MISFCPISNAWLIRKEEEYNYSVEKIVGLKALTDEEINLVTIDTYGMTREYKTFDADKYVEGEYPIMFQVEKPNHQKAIEFYDNWH